MLHGKYYLRNKLWYYATENNMESTVIDLEI